MALASTPALASRPDRTAICQVAAHAETSSRLRGGADHDGGLLGRNHLSLPHPLLGNFEVRSHGQIRTRRGGAVEPVNHVVLPHTLVRRQADSAPRIRPPLRILK